ncbi:hypothetical protein JOM56_007142 [Amanita muscaria]
MLVPSLSESSSDILIPHHDDKNPTHGYVYYKQPYSLQIIQLVECSAPPPRQILSAPSDGISAASSSSSSYDSSECTSEEDEICSSYCSSDLPPEEFEDPIVDVHNSPAPEIGDVRMKRVLAWRENFSSAMSAALFDSAPLKRKFPGDHDEDDTMSRSSKRSRLSDESSIREHSCPACDASFPTRQSLRQHGLDAAKSNEACSVAVEYAFE